MDIRNLLFSCITLLNKECRVSDDPPSATLIETAIRDVDFSHVKGEDSVFYSGLREIILGAIASGRESKSFSFDAKFVGREIELLPVKNKPVAKAIVEALSDVSADEVNVVNSLRFRLGALTTERAVLDLLDDAVMKLKYRRPVNLSIDTFKDELVKGLLELQVTDQDDAVISEVDFGDVSSLEACFDEASNMGDGHVFKLGLQELNDSLDKGLRLGEAVAIYALKHRYKSGMVLSMIDDIATLNTPPIRKEGSKPLILHLSMEDPLHLNFKFLYEKAVSEEEGFVPSLKGVPVKDMAGKVYNRLTKTGFSVKFRHLKGGDTTAAKIKSYCKRLISQGYDLQVVTMDYLLKMPTTGYKMTTTGSDIISMYSDLRDFFGELGTLFVTPFQLSPEAYSVLRGEVPEENFVSMVAGKGYMAGSKKIGEVADVELYVHSFTTVEDGERQGYLSLQLDKHKGYVIDPTKRYMLYKFFGQGPVLSDLNKEPAHMKSLGKTNGSGAASAFDF